MWPFDMFKSTPAAAPSRRPAARLSPVKAHREVRAVAAAIRRDFKAGMTDRLRASWTTSSASADQEVLAMARTIRARSRELARNDGYYKRFLSMCKENIVGPGGIRLHVRATNPDGTLDDNGNKAIKFHWHQWSKVRNCTMRKDMSWIDVQNAIVEGLFRDGEIFVRRIRGTKAGNPYGYALHLYEPEQVDLDYSGKLDNGNVVSMGIEYEPEFGKVAAYHLLRFHPGELQFADSQTKRIRIPAEQMLHLFFPHRVNARRGLPPGVVAMSDLHMTGEHTEAELVASVVASRKMGFITSPSGDGYDGDDEEEDGGALVMDVEAGSFEQLPEGMEIASWDPQHPTTAFKDFQKAVLRRIASGLGVNYNTLANDLEGVNYSSLRHGNLTERDTWRAIQRWISEHLCDWVYPDWLDMLLMSDVTKLPPERAAKFAEVLWLPRGWQWVDPEKEMKANREAIDLKIKSRQQIHGEQGTEFEDILAQLAHEHDLIEQELGPEVDEQPGDGAGGSEGVDDDDEDETAQAA